MDNRTSSVHKRLFRILQGLIPHLLSGEALFVIMGQSCFVSVHLGAGYHSNTRETAYKNLIKTCNQKTLYELETSDNLIKSLVIGIKILENSGIVNAGVGSNKCNNGNIEADAAIFQICPPCIGAISNACGHCNPIEVALDAFNIASRSENMCNVVFGKKISEIAENPFNSSMETCTSKSSDTVGIICINSKGEIAMACSSGGPEGKATGRIGPCALPGIGFWGLFVDKIGYAALFTGIGEQIILKGGAQALIHSFLQGRDTIETDSLLNSFYTSYIEHNRIELGFLFITYRPGLIQFMASHSTPSFIFSWASSGKSIKIKVSRLKCEKFKTFETCISINDP